MYRPAQVFDQARVVCDRELLVRAGKSLAQKRHVEALGRLHGGQGAALEGGLHGVPAHFLDGVRDGQSGDDGLVSGIQGAKDPADERRIDKGPGRVVDKHAAAMGRQGGQSVAHRILAAHAAGGGENGHTRIVPGHKAGQLLPGCGALGRGKDDHDAVHARTAGKGGQRTPEKGPSLQTQKLLLDAAGRRGQAGAGAGGEQHGPYGHGISLGLVLCPLKNTSVFFKGKVILPVCCPQKRRHFF